MNKHQRGYITLLPKLFGPLMRQFYYNRSHFQATLSLRPGTHHYFCSAYKFPVKITTTSSGSHLNYFKLYSQLQYLWHMQLNQFIKYIPSNFTISYHELFSDVASVFSNLFHTPPANVAILVLKTFTVEFQSTNNSLNRYSSVLVHISICHTRNTQLQLIWMWL